MKRTNNDLPKECVDICGQILTLLCKSKDEEKRKRISEYARVLEQYALTDLYNIEDEQTYNAYVHWKHVLQSELLELL